MNEPTKAAAQLTEEHRQLVERTETSLPHLQEQLRAIEELESVLQPPRKEPSFIVTSTSSGH